MSTSNKEEYKFFIQKLLDAILGKNISPEDKEKLMDALHHEIVDKPFRVAIIGQAGVGKSTTINQLFLLNSEEKLETSDITEGTTKVTEKIFPIRDGFNLSVYDMPGLNKDPEKDKKYEKMYREILPKCDVIVYVIAANRRDFGEDCRILKEVCLPICNQENIMDRFILAINKLDVIGESVDPDNIDYQWDYQSNKPTGELKKIVKTRLSDIIDKLIDENLIEETNEMTISTERIVFYSAACDYNMGSFLLSVAKSGQRGWIFPASVGLDLASKHKDNDEDQLNKLAGGLKK